MNLQEVKEIKRDKKYYIKVTRYRYIHLYIQFYKNILRNMYRFTHFIFMNNMVQYGQIFRYQLVVYCGCRYGMHFFLNSILNFFTFGILFRSLLREFHFLAPEFFKDRAAMSVLWTSILIVVKLFLVILSLKLEKVL